MTDKKDINGKPLDYLIQDGEDYTYLYDPDDDMEEIDWDKIRSID